MNNKRVLNSDELDELMGPKNEATPAFEGTRLSKKFKNSLDSDEEDDEEKAEKYNVLNPEDFDGQEESTIDHDGEIQITPFNMKDELEEGYFDKDGTFIFQKDADGIKDHWLDDIDWVKVKTTEGIKDRKRLPSGSDDDLPELDTIAHYKKMLDIMKPNETVQNAICRLGGTKRTAKRNNKSQSEAKDNENGEDKEKLQLLTEYASDIIQSGDMDIYQQTYERLTFLVKAAEEPKASIYGTSDTSDMFGDDFDEKPEAQKEASVEEPKSGNSTSDSDVTWEFKWEQKDDAPIYGPHPTSEMLRWVQEGYFADGVHVRQTGKSDGPFYSSKRIDFELYL